MPTYELIDVETGERVSVERSAARAPKFGAEVVIRGRRFVRPVSDAPRTFRDRTVDMRSIAVDPWHPAARRHDKDGQPIFGSEHERLDFCRRSQDMGMGYAPASEARSVEELQKERKAWVEEHTFNKRAAFGGREGIRKEAKRLQRLGMAIPDPPE